MEGASQQILGRKWDIGVGQNREQRVMVSPLNRIKLRQYIKIKYLSNWTSYWRRLKHIGH